MDGWSLPGTWSEINVWVQELPTAPTTTTTIALPPPDAVKGATNYGDPGAIALIHHRNPGPYSDEALILLRTWVGQRMWGKKMPSPVIQSITLERFATLLSVGSVALHSVPLGNDLVGSIGATERPTATMDFQNQHGWWSTTAMIEPLLAMPMAYWRHYGAGEVHLIFQGQVERVVIRQSKTSVTFSEP